MDIKDKPSVNIIVKPNSKKNQVKSYDKDKEAYIVEIKAEPEKGKANIAVVKLFSKITGKKVKIVSGMTSRKKMLRFE